MKLGSFSLDNENVRMGLFIILALIALVLIYVYSKDNNTDNFKTEREYFNTAESPTEDETQSMNNSISNSNPQNNEGVLPSETWGQNEQPRPIEMTQNNLMNGQIPSECYPKDVLQSADLLPHDADSTWAQVNPNGQGALGDQNFLNSGYHIGINTVGQTLRNASYDLRSTPPNPQTQVSPWSQTTIEPDINRRAFEIGKG